jgi:hypothetical protein
VANLKIRTYKNNETRPDTTISIPISILRFAKKVIPKHAFAALHEKGIDIDLIVELAKNEDIRGNIVEIEEHKKNRKIIIAIE